MTDDEWIEKHVTITAKGDCGIIHQSVDEWAGCKACGASLDRAKEPGIVYKAIPVDEMINRIMAGWPRPGLTSSLNDAR